MLIVGAGRHAVLPPACRERDLPGGPGRQPSAGLLSQRHVRHLLPVRPPYPAIVVCAYSSRLTNLPVRSGQRRWARAFSVCTTTSTACGTPWRGSGSPWRPGSRLHPTCWATSSSTRSLRTAIHYYIHPFLTFPYYHLSCQPWAGDVVGQPKNLVPQFAERTYLQPLYQHLHKVGRVDLCSYIHSKGIYAVVYVCECRRFALWTTRRSSSSRA